MKEFFISDYWYLLPLSAVVCYFIGCFNFAVLISRRYHKDIRGIGSGNPGTMNMARTFGLKIGVINFILDALKSGAPAVAGYFIFKDYVFAETSVLVSDFARYYFGLFVIIGHIFPVTMKFKGGKGIASSMGLFVFSLPCEQWWYIFVAIGVLACAFIYILFVEWGSMASLLGVAALSVIQEAIFLVRYNGQPISVWLVLISAILLAVNMLTWIAHHKNIVKLLAGEEHKTKVIKHKKSGG